MKSEIIRKNKGVTLVSLVVTVITLILLASVSINVTIGENGIISMAKRAKEDTELASLKEQEDLEKLYEQMENGELIGGTAIGELQKTIDELNEQLAQKETEFANEKKKLEDQLKTAQTELENTKKELQKANIFPKLISISEIDVYSAIQSIMDVEGISTITFSITRNCNYGFMMFHGTNTLVEPWDISGDKGEELGKVINVVNNEKITIDVSKYRYLRIIDAYSSGATCACKMESYT